MWVSGGSTPDFAWQKVVCSCVFLIFDMLSFILKKVHVPYAVIICPIHWIWGCSIPPPPPPPLTLKMVCWPIFILSSIISFTKSSFNHVSYDVIKCPIHSGILGTSWNPSVLDWEQHTSIFPLRYYSVDSSWTITLM